MKKFLAGILCVIMMVCMLPTVEVSAAGEDEIVEIGETGVISNFDELQNSVLKDYAEFTTIDEKTIKMTMTRSVKGRIQFDNMNDKKIIIDANGKTFDGGGYNEPICVDNHCDNVTLELTGNGIYKVGDHNVLYMASWNKLIVKSAAFEVNDDIWHTEIIDGFDAVAQVDDGYDCFTITDKDGNLIKVDEKVNFFEEIDLGWDLNYIGSYSIKQHKMNDAWSRDDIHHWKVCGDSNCDDVMTEKTAHTYGNNNKCVTCGYNKQADAPTETAPTITKQPTNASIKVGETATFAVTATGTNLSYQWQIDRNDGKEFVNIENATSASYTTSTVDKDCNNFKYQCIVSNAAGNVTSNTATLTVTEEVSSAPGSKPETVPTYTIIEGANANFTQGTDKAITVRADGDFAKFTGVKVNGTLVDEKYYTAVSGSTIVTLKQEYLDTLAEGTYTMTVVFTDGDCSTNFQIKKEVQTGVEPPADTSTTNNNSANNETTSPSKDAAVSPKTGDSSMLYMAILVMGILIYSVKRVDKCRK